MDCSFKYKYLHLSLDQRHNYANLTVLKKVTSYLGGDKLSIFWYYLSSSHSYFNPVGIKRLKLMVMTSRLAFKRY